MTHIHALISKPVNPLNATFSEEQKLIFTSYVISPHWHDTGSRNPSSSKTRTYLFCIVNIMGADVLVTQGARASAAMILTLLNWINSVPACYGLTHWGRVTHICVSRLTITGSDNGLSPGRRQAIIWTNVVVLLIGPLGTNFSENSIEILTFSFKKMRLNVSSAKRQPFCPGLNVLSLSMLVKGDTVVLH